jgi:purine-binding chemotaxis protein CheW
METVENIELKINKIRKDSSGKYLSFILGKEEYCIPINKVREIIGIMNITPLPGTPDFVKGVINLRGKVIPVIDMRLRFSINASDYTEKTCIIVADIISDSGIKLTGTIVDAVSEVVNISSEEIEETSVLGLACKNDFIQGIAKAKGQVRTLVNIDSILNYNENIQN